MIPKLTLRQGQKHSLVARLHRILEVLGNKFNIQDPFVFTGVTTKLLHQFQDENNIQATEAETKQKGLAVYNSLSAKFRNFYEGQY